MTDTTETTVKLGEPLPPLPQDMSLLSYQQLGYLRDVSVAAIMYFVLRNYTEFAKDAAMKLSRIHEHIHALNVAAAETDAQAQRVAGVTLQ